MLDMDMKKKPIGRARESVSFPGTWQVEELYDILSQFGEVISLPILETRPPIYIYPRTQ